MPYFKRLIIASSASGLKNQTIGCGAHKFGRINLTFLEFWVAFVTFIEVSIIASSVSGFKNRRLAAALTVLVKCFLFFLVYLFVPFGKYLEVTLYKI